VAWINVYKQLTEDDVPAFKLKLAELEKVKEEEEDDELPF